MDALSAIVGRHPACQDESIGILTSMLEANPAPDATILGYAVSSLIDLRAVEAIDAIRDAFRREVVDFSIAGDVEDVEIALGLRDKRDTPRPRYNSFFGEWLPAPVEERPYYIAAPLPKRQEVGRNDPCPCGSGKKYKKCCL
jgi:hypothetical protein